MEESVMMLMMMMAPSKIKCLKVLTALIGTLSVLLRAFEVLTGRCMALVGSLM
jgi:hypothetical protein